jgi:hypothetical protein
MKQLTLSTLLILITAGLWAQDKTYNLDDFSELYASTSVKIELIKSSENKAEVEIVKGDADDFRLEESGDNLEIYWKNKSGYNWNNNRQANVTLYYTDIDKINVSAGANVFGDDVIQAESFDANVSSGGKLEISLNADKLKTDVSSGGSFTVEGTTNTLQVVASSGGYFGGKKLEAVNVKAKANSGGAAKVWATSSIKASSNSGGAVSYKGDPKNTDIKKDKWSGGSVSKM